MTRSLSPQTGAVCPVRSQARCPLPLSPGEVSPGQAGALAFADRGSELGGQMGGLQCGPGGGLPTALGDRMHRRPRHAGPSRCGCGLRVLSPPISPSMCFLLGVGKWGGLGLVSSSHQSRLESFLPSVTCSCVSGMAAFNTGCQVRLLPLVPGFCRVDVACHDGVCVHLRVQLLPLQGSDWE